MSIHGAPMGPHSMTSSTTLTASPYDTGVRCHPRSWIPYGQSVTEDTTLAESFGRVDFDDNEGATVCVAYIELRPDNGHTVHLARMGADDELDVELHMEQETVRYGLTERQRPR